MCICNFPQCFTCKYKFQSFVFKSIAINFPIVVTLGTALTPPQDWGMWWRKSLRWRRLLQKMSCWTRLQVSRWVTKQILSLATAEKSGRETVNTTTEALERFNTSTVKTTNQGNNHYQLSKQNRTVLLCLLSQNVLGNLYHIKEWKDMKDWRSLNEPVCVTST